MTTDFSPLKIDDTEIGTIVFRSQICLPYSKKDHPEKLYMCVYLRGKKRWQCIDKVSVKNWNKGRKFVNTLHKQDPNSWLNCIQIENAQSNDSYINGVYYPMPMSIYSRVFTHFRKNIVYVREGIMEGDNARWLYYTRKNKIWIGDTNSMFRRRDYGWLCHSSNLFTIPWEIKKWDQWNGGIWQTTETIRVTLQEDEKFKDIEKQKAKLREQIKDQATLVAKKDQHIQAHMDVSALLFNQLEKDERYELLQKSAFKTLFRQVDLCGVCFRKSKIRKCIHYDCSGACETCHDTHKDEDCIACGQKQEIQCPVCLDMHSANYVKVFKCGHITCWKCYSNAFEANKAIKKCPLCRKNI